MQRYRDGELVVQSIDNKKEPPNVLRAFPIRTRPNVSDAKLREILDAHFNTPRPKLDEEIARLDKEIAKMYAALGLQYNPEELPCQAKKF